MVDIALCQLFVLAAELPCNRTAEKEFKKCSLKHLWAWTLNEVRVQSWAWPCTDLLWTRPHHPLRVVRSGPWTVWVFESLSFLDLPKYTVALFCLVCVCVRERERARERMCWEWVCEKSQQKGLLYHELLTGKSGFGMSPREVHVRVNEIDTHAYGNIPLPLCT